MDKILELLVEDENCLSSLEIRNCEKVDALKLEKLIPNLKSLVLMDRTGHDYFFRSPGSLASIVERIARSDNSLEKLLIHHNELDKIDDELVSDAFCKAREIETTSTMSKAQMGLMFTKIAGGRSNIRKLFVEEWGKIQIDYTQINPELYTLAISKIKELKMDFASKEHAEMLFELLAKNTGQLKSLTFTDSLSIEDTKTLAKVVCNLEKVFFEFDISEDLQTSIFRTIADEKVAKLKTLHLQSAIKCSDIKAFIRATLKLKDIYFIIGETLVAKSVENLLLDSILEEENCNLRSVTLIFRNPKFYFNNKKLFQYPEEKLKRIKQRIGKLNIYYSPFCRGGFERIFS